MKFRIIFMVLFVMLCAMPMLAQNGDGETFDPGIVIAIMAAGIAGVPVELLIQKLKEFLKVQGVLAYVVALIVSLAASALYFATIAGWDTRLFIIYGLLVFATAQGWHQRRK